MMALFDSSTIGEGIALVVSKTFDMARAARHLESMRDDYLSDLQRLVEIDSGTFDKSGVDRVVDLLADWYRELGCVVKRHRHDVYGDTLEVGIAGSGSGSILLLGHTDTVYSLGTATGRPMRVEGDTILGPGTADMKAGDLAILFALRAILVQGREHLGQVSIVHNSDEEIGSPSSKALIAQRAAEVEAVLVLEPGRENGDVVVARKGIIDAEIHVTGRAAHAGVNHADGRSAVLTLARIVTELEGLNGQYPDLTVNVGRIEGGERTNVVPDRAFARVEARAFDPEVLNSVVESIHDIGRSAPVAGTEARIRVSVEHRPMPRSAGNERLFSLAQTLGRELGLELGATATGGASDGNTAAAAGKPVLDGLGPVGGGAHSEREYVRTDSIVPRTALLAGLITALRNGVLDDAPTA
jgi:glutamate carboxypeptidase